MVIYYHSVGYKFETVRNLPSWGCRHEHLTIHSKVNIGGLRIDYMLVLMGNREKWCGMPIGSV
jgi:hypothetical protein